MISVRVEKHVIRKNNELYKYFDDLCFQSKNIYNAATYLIRQEFIETSKKVKAGELEQATIPKSGELYRLLKDSDARGDIPSASYSLELRSIQSTWKGFFKAAKDYKKHPEKYTGRPKMPGYLHKEKGRYPFAFYNNSPNALKIKDGYLHTEATFLKRLNGIFKVHFKDYSKIAQIRIVPKPGYYNFEIVYEVEVPDLKEESKRIAAIDLGVNNLMTIVTNFGTTPVVINGRPLKSMNQYYNKELAKMHSELMLYNGQYTSKRIENFTNKRNRKVDDYIQKATKMVIDYCLENDIDTLVCGYNPQWKTECDLGNGNTKVRHKNNQNFVQIPHLSIVNRLSYKCEQAGIRFILIRESYTSGTSFLDYEEAIKENYDKERRIYRGLFISNKGIEINGDVNGAYQILVKAFPEELKERGHVKRHPVILDVPYIRKENIAKEYLLAA